jgi:two-component system, chemotaxis family, protein-glutamate methylesterase/glutaminase
MNKTKVLIIDDSKVMQELLQTIFESSPDFEVVGKAVDPYIARELIKQTNPDVLTLDIEMPRMDGITFLKNLMRLRPMPVIMVSSYTEKGSQAALEALALGAVDCIPKPSATELKDISVYAKELLSLTREAATAKLHEVEKHPDEPLMPTKNWPDDAQFLKNQVIAVGASTGGIEAFEHLLMQLPKNVPGILMVQHIRKEFIAPLVKRIDKFHHLTVVEATHHQTVVPNHVYIATGDKHLTIRAQKDGFICMLNDEPPMNNHKPAVDALFHSVAKTAGARSIGVLLTGMGQDGARGLGAIRAAGGTTIAQDEATSVVWGMPGTAVKLNAVDSVLPIEQMGNKLLAILNARARDR